MLMKSTFYTMRSVKYIHGDTKHMLINHNLSAHDTEQMSQYKITKQAG